LLRRTSRFELDGEVARSHWPRYGVTTLPMKFTPPIETAGHVACSSH
jgi:hypothetical protein